MDIISLAHSFLSGEGQEVLELGAGEGLFARELCEAGFSVTMIEFSPAKAEAAQRNAPAAMLIADDFLHHTFTKQFDCIFAVSFLHLFPKSQCVRVLTKIRSLLAPGGVVVVATAASAINSKKRENIEALGKSLLRLSKRFTRDELVSYIEQAGFQTLHFEVLSDSSSLQSSMVFVLSIQ